jgi:hypothetical protein
LACSAVAFAICSSVSSPTSSFATAHAAADVSRLMVCNRIPNRTLRPRACANVRTSSILAAAACGGSPQVRYTSTYSAATGSAAADEPPK